MFKIEYFERKSPENKNIYVSSLSSTQKILFTNKYHLLEFHKDLDNFFQEYYFLLDTFYFRVKSFDYQLLKDGFYGPPTSKIFFDLEEIRLNIFSKSTQKKSPQEVAHFINQFNTSMMLVCFRVSKKNYVEAEKIYHLLSDLQTKFYSVFLQSYELHQQKQLKLFL